MKKTILLVLSIASFLLIADLLAPARAQDRTPGPVIQGSTDPYEVTLYEERDYRKPIHTWRLAPGMRLLKVPTPGGAPRSILVGSSVGVLLFYDWHFSSSFHVITGETVYFGKQSDYTYSLVTRKTFENSSPLMFASGRLSPPPDRYSLIIHRKDLNDWLGVELERGANPSSSREASYQFYPLPEDARERVIIYPKIPAGSPPYRLGLVAGANYYPHLNGIEVTGTEASGGTFRFPDPKNPKPRYDLEEYGVRQPSSMKIEYRGPFDGSAYVYAARAVAPAAPNVAEVGTQLPQAHPAGPAKLEAPAAKVAQTAILNVSGQWQNSFGWTYTITQQQDAFQWTILNSSEKGTGTIKGYDLSVSWQGPQGSGSAQGKVSEVDASGTAKKILWSNGVQFFR